MFLNEWFAVDLVKNQDGEVVGVIAIEIETGEMVYVESKATVFATGGAGRIYASTTNALMNTGDGVGMALRAGLPVQDMEMWQFHPTGIAGRGRARDRRLPRRRRLPDQQGRRALHGALRAEREGPRRPRRSGALDGPRDSSTAAAAGPNGDHVLLKLDHLGEEVLNSRLPGILELSKTFAHVDPIKEPIPVVPTCHYMMGGIPTSVHGQALQPGCGRQRQADRGAVCGRRSGVRFGSRRQPSRRQFTARPRGLRPRGGPAHRRSAAAGRELSRGERQRPRSRAAAAQSAGTNRRPARSVADAEERRCRPSCRTTSACSAPKITCRKASSSSPNLRERIAGAHLQRQEQRVQHRAYGSARTRQSARSGGSDRDHRRGAQGKPRRPRARRLSGSRRCELVVPFAISAEAASAWANARSTSRPNRSRRCSRPSVRTKCWQRERTVRHESQRVPIQPGDATKFRGCRITRSICRQART